MNSIKLLAIFSLILGSTSFGIPVVYASEFVTCPDGTTETFIEDCAGICEDGNPPSVPIGGALNTHLVCEELITDSNAGVFLCLANFCQCPEGFHNGDVFGGEDFCIKNSIQQNLGDAIRNWIFNILFSLFGDEIFDYFNPIS